MGIETQKIVNVGRFLPGQRKYLDFHRDKVLLKMYQAIVYGTIENCPLPRAAAREYQCHHARSDDKHGNRMGYDEGLLALHTQRCMRNAFARGVRNGRRREKRHPE